MMITEFNQKCLVLCRVVLWMNDLFNIGRRVSFEKLLSHSTRTYLSSYFDGTVGYKSNDSKHSIFYIAFVKLIVDSHSAPLKFSKN